ncbi:nicotinate-nucleotide--dimethylbenzimidazole phosphoribosyltransferase [Desulfovibrio sp. OttesenSCG-928-G15]|nr:nicotinate-nucleotide--dimethylbenzimidazole phosphoribosyltransferase [Desulfovibrio sp. OttesenSCG-928-G15]
MQLPAFLSEECARIAPLSQKYARAAKQRLDGLSKPLGSLGRLEDLAVQMYAVQQNTPIAARPARMFTVAADHGVVEEGVAASPKAVTALMVHTFLRGGAAVNALCGAAGVDFCVVDAGVDAEAFAPDPRLVNAKIARGTANMALGPAMTRDQCERALALGISLAEKAAGDGMRVVGTGEMGIGNTTASSALFCAFLDFSPSEMTGMGAGMPPRGLVHKTYVIERALAKNREALVTREPLAVLAAVGGLEIATLVGLILGGAARQMLVMIDGFIATAAFVCAQEIAPAVRDYCVFCHGSAETGHARVLERLNVQPLLDLGMRVGEGTGAALGMMLLDAAARVYNEMSLLDDVGIAL